VVAPCVAIANWVRGLGPVLDQLILAVVTLWSTTCWWYGGRAAYIRFRQPVLVEARDARCRTCRSLFLG